MADKDDAAGQLFSACVFTFVQSKDLGEGLIDELSKSAIHFGAQVVDTKRDRSLQLEKVTHIISNTIDFPQFTDAAAMMIPVVKSQWISASLVRNKQAQIRPYSPDPRMVFSEVILSCADIPPTDKEAIIGATMAMGGVDSENITKLVTHICALSMDHPKCRTAIEKNLKCKIVLPHWFDDCFRLGKRIDEGPYLLPDPEILRARPEDDIPVPSSEHLEGATSARPQYIPTPADSIAGARPKLTVFNEKKVMLSWDLSISARLKDIIQRLIRDGGGDLTESVEDCDFFICQFREGDQYVRASHGGKDVGNLSWLYHLITHNEWTSPMRRLLHYPIPKNGIPGFQGQRITVSNYGGEARIYLENLITAAGATYTKTMKADNTHLITARNNSEKCEAARDWNIHMINHLWIEESYAKCEMQSLAVEKYIHFPARTNLGEVIGQTQFDESRLHALYYPGGPEKPTLASSRKRKLLDMAQANAYSDGPAEGVSIGRQARKEFDVMKDSDADYADKTTEVFVATPARGRHVRVGKENETPSTVSSSSRSAKNKAQKRLSDLAPDIALYEKEKKRIPKDGQPWGGKRAADLIEREHLDRRSVSSPTDAQDDDDESPAMKKRPAKRANPTLPEIEMRVILTGFKRWVNDKYKEDADRKKLRDLGIAVVTDGQACDFLVAPQVVRTVKFLRNLSKGATVLSSSWIEQCLDTGKVPPPGKYLLKDKENEKKFTFKLQVSVERAARNQEKLLWNIPIYCTASIKNGTESYRAIADANGAIFMVYAARSGTTIRPTKPEEDEGGPEPVYLLSTATPEEKRLWPKFESMARQGNMEPRVVASDWLLDVVMKQELSFDKRYLVANFFS
ncbi:BRCA1 C terminus domain-containing protein [Xylariales sp. AK1849]|nr:BRCA1 C terminus domain-containing protein [Xylariales sp. AK1849]